MPGFAAPPAKSGDEPPPTLPQIPGVDVAAGIDRVGGNAAVFWRLLATFVTSRASIAEGLERAVAAADLDRVRALAHQLKGASGNLSLLEVHRAATELEKGARAIDVDAVRANWTHVAQALHRACDAVLAAKPGLGAVAAPPVAAGKRLSLSLPSLRSLQTMIVDRDFASVDRFESFAVEWGAEFARDADFCLMRDALRRYAFEDAMAAIAALIERIERTPAAASEDAA